MLRKSGAPLAASNTLSHPAVWWGVDSTWSCGRWTAQPLEHEGGALRPSEGHACERTDTPTFPEILPDNSRATKLRWHERLPCFESIQWLAIAWHELTSDHGTNSRTISPRHQEIP